ncbi:MAG: hypothetical protein QXL16_01130 [Candidatus Micrarchaeaceae archaeon]
MAETIIISKYELKKMLIALKVDEKRIDMLLSELQKSRRHANVVAFAGMLQKMGLKEEDVKRVLRRIGLDDVKIRAVIETLDEEKIKAAFSRVVEAVLE